MSFHKAIRKQVKLRLALCGPSGSGKTYSALLIAQGLAPDRRIALIDTERGSGELYSHLADYDAATLAPPFTPERYIKLIRDAEQAGYAVLIIDSLSHAWTGEGGVLDMHDKATLASRSGNSFMSWREVTPHHNALVDAIIGANLHVIATMRTKTAYDLVDDGKGGKKPIKVGLAPVQREGMEYEFTVVMDLSVDNHIATAAKDRTSLFDSRHFAPSPDTGVALREWLDSGVDPTAASQTLLDALKAVVAEIDSVTNLENWWRAHQGEISALLAVDLERLKLHCAIRKTTLLDALKPKPDSPPRVRGKKGNGEDRAHPQLESAA